MNTTLCKVLEDPRLKSGVILAPCLSGKTYALCKKAVILAEGGQDVLFVVPTIEQAKAEGGMLSAMKVILEQMSLSFRISENSLNIQVAGGKIKIADTKFTPDKVFDTALFSDSFKRAPIFNNKVKYFKNSIHFLDIEDALYDIPHYSCKGLLRLKYDIGGDISNIGLSKHSEVLEGLGKGYKLSVNEHGDFSLVIDSMDETLKQENLTYVNWINTLPEPDRTFKLSTDLTKCYDLLPGGLK